MLLIISMMAPIDVYKRQALHTLWSETDGKADAGTWASLSNVYNKIGAEMCIRDSPIPDKSYTFENPEVTISAGQAISSAASLSIADDSEFVPGRVYLIPVTIKSATGDLDIIEAGRTICLLYTSKIRF